MLQRARVELGTLAARDCRSPEFDLRPRTRFSKNISLETSPWSSAAIDSAAGAAAGAGAVASGGEAGGEAEGVLAASGGAAAGIEGGASTSCASQFGIDTGSVLLTRSAGLVHRGVNCVEIDVVT